MHKSIKFSSAPSMMYCVCFLECREGRGSVLKHPSGFSVLEPAASEAWQVDDCLVVLVVSCVHPG